MNSITRLLVKLFDIIVVTGVIMFLIALSIVRLIFQFITLLPAEARLLFTRLRLALFNMLEALGRRKN